MFLDTLTPPTVRAREAAAQDSETSVYKMHEKDSEYSVYKMHEKDSETSEGGRWEIEEGRGKRFRCHQNHGARGSWNRQAGGLPHDLRTYQLG